MPEDPRQTWPGFIAELQQSILPIYRAHELTFDWAGVHGRMHISRAVIFGEVMARIYHAAGIPVDFYGMRVAIAFHDSGREGSGTDRWEKESAENASITLWGSRPIRKTRMRRGLSQIGL